MNRRRFLGFLAGTTAALTTGRAASAQPRSTGRFTPTEAPVAPRPVGAAAAPGVSGTEVRVGMSAAFRGTLHPEVLAHPLTSGAIRYTSITTGVAVLSNLGGNANDFRELLTDVGVFDSPDFDLNVSQDPLR